MTKFQTPRGTRDFLPETMIKRQKVLDTLRSIFEKWGFDPLETPAFEDWSLLAAKSGGGDAIRDEIYYFRDKSNRELGLRFDLTVPLARVIANNPNLPKPFKRYHIGRVWRYDRPGTGRYREFWQADVDIIGSAGHRADAEVLATACDALEQLGLMDFRIRLSSRKLVESFLRNIGVKDISAVFRSIDKLEKIGENNVAKELKDKGLQQANVEEILDFIKLKNVKDIEAAAKDKEAVNEITDIVNILGEYGYSKY
ncbi:MAG TPA: HisS family protein, partial [archaeon]|nr:HisS family protein [archaeon]